ncbi:hypothetical protein [Halanaerobacter jeridensis]|uniref:Membrane protein YfcA n=1 Tax=Halanaerobacter jeridensis TaxID=706427 RepID=A0A938XRF1_9FIRM|nr:hypothetical protein [Halanaerobacter jeridensis]MBM7556364.1 putative membrane protein YfcA [Halanaerobacter jeridensis]
MIKKIGFGVIISLVLLLLQIGWITGIIILSIIIAAQEIYSLAYLQRNRIDWKNVVFTELGGIIVYGISYFL